MVNQAVFEPDAPSAAGTRIQSVERGCRLLLWLAEREEGTTAKEAAFAHRLSLPTTYHLLNTLIDQGFVEKDADRRYALGRSSGLLARACLGGEAVPEPLLDALRGVAERTGETTHLVGWGEGAIRVLASVEGSRMVRVAAVAAGPYEAAHARAAGKVLLAHAAAARREAYLRHHPIARHTSRTICDPDLFERELEAVRRRGYAVDEEAFAAGVSCLAAPIRGDGGAGVAALGLSVPAKRFARLREGLTRELLATTEAVEVAAEDGSAARIEEVGIA